MSLALTVAGAESSAEFLRLAGGAAAAKLPAKSHGSVFSPRKDHGRGGIR